MPLEQLRSRCLALLAAGGELITNELVMEAGRPSDSSETKPAGTVKPKEQTDREHSRQQKQKSPSHKIGAGRTWRPVRLRAERRDA